MNEFPANPSRYLDAHVATASQPELQLILLDGALRFGRQAQQLWAVPDQRPERDRLLVRTLEIVEELVRSTTVGNSEPSKRFEEEYAFAYRQLTLAQLNQDAASLESALMLLAYQRETWKMACEKLRADAPTPVARPSIPQPHSGHFAGQNLSLQG